MPHASTYLKAIEKALAAGNATEHTYRPALQRFIEQLGDGITATNEPKRVRCGAPDYVVTRGETPLGYVEAKDVGRPLDREEKSEQMGRYLEGLDNLILTDYLEFRWYVRGEHVQTARLGTLDARGERVRVEPGGAEEVEKLLAAFLTEVIPTVSNPKELAERMARVARLIRDTISRSLKTEGAGGSLHQQMKGFREVLIHDLTEEQFADMYAQTICYGLFAARVNHRGSAPFTRRDAAHELPRTNPFLRKLFQHVAGPDLDEEAHAWAVDGLADLLNRTDIAAILKDFGRSTRREDPVVHFYETFLAAYDPRMREARGVYYTPEPVVSYIVRSVDHILKTDFNLADGLADASRIKLKDSKGRVTGETHKVLVLDPATGTGTFLYGVINHIFETFRRNRGMWSAYVSEHLLPRLFGFELLMAPYAVAHMKLGLQLAETGYDFQQDERLRVYLTNTLEEAHEVSRMPLFTQWLAAEANEASRIKQDAPVMVVLGNPPYSGHSANTGLWIANLLRGHDTMTGKETGNYFKVDGQPLGERNPKWLNDDYVKFIRFAQWRIEQTGHGVLAFITNHGYLDNPTFRGMRQSLMQTFDDIYVLDLHGNSKKKESAPDGSKDENVFDIQQGVAIGIFVKRKGASSGGESGVRHAHLWGVREIYEENTHGERVLSGGKYDWLWQHDVTTTKWTTLEPQSPFYYFMPQNKELLFEYEAYHKVSDIFPLNGWGIATRKDYLLIDFEQEPLVRRFEDIRQLPSSKAVERYEIVQGEDWVEAAKKHLKGDLAHYARPILYRPFDVRHVLYKKELIERGDHRYNIMQHLLHENLSLITTRITKEPFAALAFAGLSEHKASVRYDGTFVFPLYLYPNNTKESLFDDDEPTDAPGGRRPNLAPGFVAEFGKRLKMSFIADGKGDRRKTFGPEDVFDYMYAVFHAPGYRARYAEFLKIDFPRLPLTSDAELFRSLCALGSELVGLHLMERRGPAVASFPVKGDNTVEAVRYTEPGAEAADEGRVWINKTQYFEGVPEAVWSFHVGGYQVCQKWLKDRKGRKLTFDDLQHYQQIVSALSETIRLMALVDDTIDEHGGWPLDAQNAQDSR
jgi:predicted helicase